MEQKHIKESIKTKLQEWMELFKRRNKVLNEYEESIFAAGNSQLINEKLEQIQKALNESAKTSEKHEKLATAWKAYVKSSTELMSYLMEHPICESSDKHKDELLANYEAAAKQHNDLTMEIAKELADSLD